MSILNPFVIKFISENSSKPGFENLKIKIDNSLKGEGFSSKLTPFTIVNIRGCILEHDDYVVKIAPGNPQIRDLIPFEKIYEREIFIYEKVLPEFQKIQEEHKLPRWEMSACAPECFATSLEKKKECLILENLGGIREFVLWEKEKVMPRNHIELVLQEYAKFHALSFAMRTHKPKVLSFIEENTPDLYMDIITECKTIDTIKILCNRITESFRNCEDQRLFEKTSLFSDNVIDIMKELVRSTEASEYKALLHGDSWNNNMLFRYKANSEQVPIDVKYVDWQLARFGSPILDISSFLYSSASKSMLDNLDELLKVYYMTFEVFLKKFGCAADELFPFDELVRLWPKFAKFGLGMAVLILHIMVMDEGETPNVDKENQSGEDFIKSFQSHSKNDGIYLSRTKDIFQHFVEKGFL